MPATLWSPSTAAALRGALADALALLLPVDCAGCGRAGRALCDPCARELEAGPGRVRTIDGMRVHSAASFDGIAAAVVRAIKEDGRTGLARSLGRLVGAAAREAGWGDAVIVPVPSSRAALRRRGYVVPELVAARTGLPWVRGLRVARASSDQRALGRDDRARNVAGTFRAVRIPAAEVVLLDDVVTTGATLREARRALEAGGIRVCGALAVADTPRRNPR